MVTPMGGVIWLLNKKNGIENPNYGIRKEGLRFLIWKILLRELEDRFLIDSSLGDCW